ncbi:MAG: nucleotidyltransferase family protein [Emcibacteraceae bacterium]|nr:nucleotidyltransferase family protein [Emcibacteraceae bacterium]
MDKNEFIERISQNKNNSAILERLQTVQIKDIWLVSGSLFQTVWSTLTDREPTYGIKDYDIFYFDNDDLSWDAENIVIKQLEILFADLNINVQVRNQARVHLWYEQHFGVSYPPLKSTCEAIDRFLMPAAMVGIQPSETLELYAPKGLDDLNNMVIRPNLSDNFNAQYYYEKAKRWKKTWPELKVMDVL